MFVSMWISAAFLLFTLTVNGVITATSGEVKGVGRKCPHGWEKFGTQCFKYYSESKPWAEAERQCVDLGGNLVSIHSENTHSFLKTFLKNKSDAIGRTWIGAHDATKEFIWFWSDGSKFVFSDWHSGEPNNGGGYERCAEMGYGDEQRWNDANCDTRLPFICYRAARIEFQN